MQDAGLGYLLPGEYPAPPAAQGRNRTYSRIQIRDSSVDWGSCLRLRHKFVFADKDTFLAFERTEKYAQENDSGQCTHCRD